MRKIFIFMFIAIIGFSNTSANTNIEQICDNNSITDFETGFLCENQKVEDFDSNIVYESIKSNSRFEEKINLHVAVSKSCNINDLNSVINDIEYDLISSLTSGKFLRLSNITEAMNRYTSDINNIYGSSKNYFEIIRDYEVQKILINSNAEISEEDIMMFYSIKEDLRRTLGGLNELIEFEKKTIEARKVLNNFVLQDCQERLITQQRSNVVNNDIELDNNNIDTGINSDNQNINTSDAIDNEYELLYERLEYLESKMPGFLERVLRVFEKSLNNKKHEKHFELFEVITSYIRSR